VWVPSRHPGCASGGSAQSVGMQWVVGVGAKQVSGVEGWKGMDVGVRQVGLPCVFMRQRQGGTMAAVRHQVAKPLST
jgi:hypothetical protein